jgi:hypothetical protein
MELDLTIKNVLCNIELKIFLSFNIALSYDIKT